MRSPRPASALSLPSVFAGAGLLCLACVTLVDRGATRAYATPWIWLFWVAHLMPFAALMLRTLRSGPPLAFPERRWLVLAAVFAATVLASALLSPHRGPAVLAALTPLAGVATYLLVHDWIQRGGAPARLWLGRFSGLAGVTIAAFSLVPWTIDRLAATPVRPVLSWLDYRNDYPLGHSNYTAGLALLSLPWLGALAWHSRGRTRLGWTLATLLGLLMLFTSGSRGGLVGLAALVGATILQAHLGWKRLVTWLVLAIVITGSLALSHPRTRTLLLQRSPATLNLHSSTVQRSAMAHAGLRMGADRPLLGWGPGTTPLVYPQFRASLDGGVENALQLHSTPVQLWADLGLLGLFSAAGFLALLARESRAFRQAAATPRAAPASIAVNTPMDLQPTAPMRTPAVLALTGYGVFALTDFQFDVPVFTFAFAVATAVLARAGEFRSNAVIARVVGLAATAVLILVGLFGARDQAPVLNSRALELAAKRPQEEAAIALLRQSLALNPHQEIAHFNLGWLLVVRDPVQAEQHFLAAARLVPDKGGVYFGLALARLNQGAEQRDRAAAALALECLNDPLFLTSPWWRQPVIAALRAVTLAHLRSLTETARVQLAARDDLRSRDATYVVALAEWLEGTGPLAAVLANSHTPERVRYFAARPPVPDLATAPGRAYRRERTGYPVLMRNLDLPPPRDLFDVQENVLAADELRFLFPPKGWLPGPLLLALLAQSNSTNP